MDFQKSIEEIYNSSKQTIKNNKGDLFLSHFGELDSDKISELSEETESKLFEIGAAKRNIKNIFNILIEGLQNIINHGDYSLEKKQSSFFNLAIFEEAFICSFANLIDNQKIDYLFKNIDYLNTLDKAGLKSVYLETLTNGQISKKGGAGLGVIIMAMKSKNKIVYSSIPIDDTLSMVSLDIKVDKL